MGPLYVQSIALFLMNNIYYQSFSAAVFSSIFSNPFLIYQLLIPAFFETDSFILK